MFRLKWNKAFFKATNCSPFQRVIVGVACFAKADGSVALNSADLQTIAGFADTTLVHVMNQIEAAKKSGWITPTKNIDGVIHLCLRIP